MKKILAAVLCLVVIFSACGKKEAPQECVSIANQFISCYTNADFEGMYALTNDEYPYFNDMYNPDDSLNKALFDALTKNLSYEITGGEDFGESANVKLHVSNINAEQLLGSIVDEFTNLYKQNPDTYENMDMDAELEKIVTAKIASAPYTEKDTSIDFIKQDGKWVIENNIGLYDDLSGGYMTYYFNANVVQGAGTVVTEAQ